jgi:two-component system sensor kinase FixL
VVGDGATQWRAGRGRMEHGKDESRWLCGVTMDITERKAAEIDMADKRNELAHLSRVNLLGELSSSMAHELNQPLTAILANAEAARLHLQAGHLDKVELGAILDDIIEADTRAGDVITSMRKMLRKESHATELLNVNDLVGEVLRLMRSDLLSRGAVVEYEPSPAAPATMADRVQLQQVLINLIVNGCDAMTDLPRGRRILRLRTEAVDGKVRVVVSDRGSGIPPEMLNGIFKPFFSTKAHGLGLGLSVCSSILALHGGALRASNNSDGGATFSVELEEAVPALA